MERQLEMKVGPKKLGFGFKSGFFSFIRKLLGIRQSVDNDIGPLNALVKFAPDKRKLTVRSRPVKVFLGIGSSSTRHHIVVRHQHRIEVAISILTPVNT